MPSASALQRSTPRAEQSAGAGNTSGGQVCLLSWSFFMQWLKLSAREKKQQGKQYSIYTDTVPKLINIE